MKLNSIGKAFGTTLSATALVALTLSGCGSDNNAGTSSSTSGASGTSSASADCGGKNSLTAEGSTAQQNAIAEFNKVWGQVCSGKSLAYNPTGSGAGVDQFIAKQVDFAGSDSALKDDQVAEGCRPLRRQPGVEPSAGVRPCCDGLQRRGRRQARRQR